MLKLLLITSLAIQRIMSSPIEGDFNLLILHNNDMHARFDETHEAKGGRIVGGFARTSHLIKEARKDEIEGKGPPVLYLNAGDTYTGTVWFTVHKDKIASEFMNALDPNAMALGNHEFDFSVEGLLPFLENTTFPMLACNLDLSKEPRLQKFVRKSVVLSVHGRKVGIIGYLTPETEKMSTVGKVGFLDEISSIQTEAKRLTKEGVNIIIALGHSGFKKDKEIARNVKEVDLVVGGHTNTFLWNGEYPDNEIPEDEYPAQVVQKNGKIVPVVQAYAYTKYLGKLLLTFDKNGLLTTFKGQPIFIDSSIPKDPEVDRILTKYRPEIEALNTTSVGTTKVFLEADSCRSRECNFGNLVMDAFVFYRSRNRSGTFWTDSPIALMNAGAIRQSINATRRGNNVFEADVLGALPFGQLVFAAEISGEDLMRSLEIGARSNGETSKGEFLLTSGLKVEYDLAEEVGRRVKAAKARCADCHVPSYSPIDAKKSYNILTTGYLIRGGDGHTVLKEKAENPVSLGVTEAEVLSYYLRSVNYVLPELDERTSVGCSGSSDGVKLEVSAISMLVIVWFNKVLIC